MLKAKMISHLSNFYNILDLIALALFWIGIIFRFIPDRVCYEVARYYTTKTKTHNK